MDFGEVHAVFAGRFRNEFKDICNRKRHVRLTPFKSKHDLPHQIQFVEDNRFFHVMLAEKRILCKKCVTVHMISEACYTEQKGPV